MRPPWWRHYKINMAFHFGERLIIIVNSGGLISVTRVLMVLILVGLSLVLMVFNTCRVVEGGQILEPGSLVSSEPWWYRCITLSDDPIRFGKFCEFRVLVKLAESRSVIYCKRSRSWCDWHLYRKPVIYRSNTCRNSENAFRIPTLIQRNLIQITNVLHVVYTGTVYTGTVYRYTGTGTVQL